MIKVLLLADINSPHTSKWALSLASNGFTVGIFSLSRCDSNWFRNIKNIEYLSEGTGHNAAKKKELGKLVYIRSVKYLRKVIQEFKPDIVHAHYATSYGMLGSYSGFHPFIISVWGSDVYDFPKRSFLHKFLFKRNLANADAILSTSNIMAAEIALYTNKKIEVTPFGVDLNVFKPQKVKSVFNEGDIVVGTVKALEAKYGIDYLIEAFDILCKKHPDLPLKLLIVGRGSQERNLMRLVEKMGLESKVKFTGRVPHDKVHDYYNMLDVFVALSLQNRESFGVCAVEAQASGIPVVVSNVGGFAEVVENGATGLIVPVKNSKVAANAIEKILMDKELAAKMAVNGRKRVAELYDWSNNLKEIINIYNRLLNK